MAGENLPHEKMTYEKDTEVGSMTTAGRDDVFSLSHVDPALNDKLHLVNNAIDEIGWTTYQTKLFFLNGFGYAVDSLILLLQSITAGQAALEFRPSFANGMTIAVYIGMLTGALFWGFGADMIGRKVAFNYSLFICSVFAIAAGASPNWEVLGLFVALSAFGGGGNLILDTAVFLEFCPSKYSWVLTFMASWWGVGQLVAGLVAWPFLSDYACADAASCTYANNKGWRYEWYTCGALVFLLSILRVTVIRLHETPKYLLSTGRDAEVASSLQSLAQKYGRPCSLTLDQLEACGTVKSDPDARISFSAIRGHISGLFATRSLGLSTSLIWFSWLLIGLAYPLFNVFLPQYLKSRGASFGAGSNYETWRNYAIANVAGIFGPVLAGFMCNWRVLKRKGTMIVGALATMVFFFAYTQVRTQPQNLGFSCAINFALNIYYGTLYAYTPEVLPSAHRTTGNGVAVACNRIMGIMSAIVATYADTRTSVPIYLCAALFAVLAGVSAVMPFEPFGRRSM